MNERIVIQKCAVCRGEVVLEAHLVPNGPLVLGGKRCVKATYKAYCVDCRLVYHPDPEVILSVEEKQSKANWEKQVEARAKQAAEMIAKKFGRQKEIDHHATR